MTKPTVILATSNGVGMGHLARASAIALALKEYADPIIVSMAGGIAEIPDYMGIRCEYIPGRDRGWMPREKWDQYLRDRLLALVDETGAKVMSFDGVVPYPGVIAAKFSHPKLALVWVRRGLWQKKPQRFVLGLQSKMMDYIVEPGDIARAYDFGPTASRKDATLTSPVSLYKEENALSREEARKVLGLDLDRPAVLVQLGTGDSDVNEKLTAALSGLIGWKDLQVILTKHPVDKDGKSLAPEGLDIRVVRHFPLARVLHAFDAGVSATGYNGVHENLPACLPTVFVSNIRGTDDQEARAQWSHDMGFALRANQADLADITATVRKLQDPATRERLSRKCAELPEPVHALRPEHQQWLDPRDDRVAGQRHHSPEFRYHDAAAAHRPGHRLGQRQRLRPVGLGVDAGRREGHPRGAGDGGRHPQRELELVGSLQHPVRWVQAERPRA